MSINNVEITNMVMIYNPLTDCVLMQNRVKSWVGVAFPGGHLENGESMYDSAIREVWEETGLRIKNLKYCGIIHWSNLDDGNQTFIHYYRTSDFEGELVSNDEGQNFWCPTAKIMEKQLSSGFEYQIDMFFNDNVHELLILYDNKNTPFVYKWF